MIDDELLNNGQSSPPPPAPNGENSSSTEIFQPTINQQQQQQQQHQQQQQQKQFQNASWNPFCSPAIQQQDSHPQLSSMNPFAADLMKQQVFIETKPSQRILLHSCILSHRRCTHARTQKRSMSAFPGCGKEFHFLHSEQSKLKSRSSFFSFS